MEEKEKIIYRTFRTIVKAVDDKEGVIDMMIPMSTGSVDRHKESINPLGWKKSLKEFKKRAILVSSHIYDDLRKQIGEFIEMEISKEGLFAKPKYYINQGNDEADWGFKLATMGMAAFSVGFIPIKWQDSKDEPTRTYLEQELVEISHVIVPSNRDAIQKMKSESEDPILIKVIDDILNKEGLIESGEEKKEIITKPEVTEKYIRIPVNDCKITATIDIDKKQGIKALYCGKVKKVATYLFEKAKGWTLAKAKKWVEDHSKTITDYLEKFDWDVDYEPEEIDWEKVMASIEKDEKEEFLKEYKVFDKMAIRFLPVYLAERKQKLITELYYSELKDIELKAGAVLNAKNKKDLKTAQVLIQSVLDSAGEEENQEGEDEKDSKKGDTVITIIDDKKEDPPKDEKKDKDLIEVDEKVIAEIIEKKMNYLVGKTDK